MAGHGKFSTLGEIGVGSLPTPKERRQEGLSDSLVSGPWKEEKELSIELDFRRLNPGRFWKGTPSKLTSAHILTL